MRQEEKIGVVGRLALITLGSNNISPWGDAAETVQKAMDLVSKKVGSPAKHSKLYLTPAFPEGSGPEFVNAAMALPTDLAARDLLSVLHQIEASAGRARDVRWGPRTLDIDLIGLGDEVWPDVEVQTRWRDLPLAAQARETPDQLILPHPRVQDRSFALVPLSDVAPGWKHPIIGETVQQMLNARPAAERASVRPF